MAAIVVVGELDFDELREHLARLLPPYARPKFLRVTDRIAATSTFKHTKASCNTKVLIQRRQTTRSISNDAAKKAFVRLDAALYARIQAGKVRL